MRTVYVALVAAIGICLGSPAFAGWHTAVVRSMYIVTDPSAADPGVRIMVTGAFTPALPCTLQYFFLLPSDPLFKEVYAMLLTAQTTGAPIQYNHEFCHSNGLSRGSNYISAVE
jgi:hypothetical protein